MLGNNILWKLQEIIPIKLWNIGVNLNIINFAEVMKF